MHQESLDNVVSKVHSYMAINDLTKESFNQLSSAVNEYYIPKLKSWNIDEILNCLGDFENQLFKDFKTTNAQLFDALQEEANFECKASIFKQLCQHGELISAIKQYLELNGHTEQSSALDIDPVFQKLKESMGECNENNFKKHYFAVEEIRCLAEISDSKGLVQNSQPLSHCIKGQTIPIMLPVVAPKGGAGKTTILTNVAYILAKDGYKVLVVDADHQCNATAELMLRMHQCYGNVSGKNESSYFELTFAEFKDFYINFNDKEHSSGKAQCKKFKNAVKAKFKGKFSNIDITSADNIRKYNELKHDLKALDTKTKAVVAGYAQSEKIKKKIYTETNEDSAINAIKAFYKDDEHFFTEFGESVKKKTKTMKERTNFPMNNLLRFLISYQDEEYDKGELHEQAMESIQLMDFSECYSIKSNGRLLLLPGSLHLDRVNMDPIWNQHQEHKAKKSMFFNLGHALRIIAGYRNVDVVLIDQNPGATPLNHSLWFGSDYMIIPFEPSYFSRFSTEVLITTLKQWFQTTQNAYKLLNAGRKKIAYEDFNPAKIIAAVISKLPEVNKDGKTGTYKDKQYWKNKIDITINEAIAKIRNDHCQLVINGKGNIPTYAIPRFDRTNEHCQKYGLPVSASDLLPAGLNLTKERQTSFKEAFKTLSQRILLAIASDPKLSEAKRHHILHDGLTLFNTNYKLSWKNFTYNNVSEHKIDEECFKSSLYMYDYIDMYCLLHEHIQSGDLKIFTKKTLFLSSISELETANQPNNNKEFCYLIYNEDKWVSFTFKPPLILIDNDIKDSKLGKELTAKFPKYKLQDRTNNRDCSELVELISRVLSSRSIRETSSVEVNRTNHFREINRKLKTITFNKEEFHKHNKQFQALFKEANYIDHDERSEVFSDINKLNKVNTFTKTLASKFEISIYLKLLKYMSLDDSANDSEIEAYCKIHKDNIPTPPENLVEKYKKTYQEDYQPDFVARRIDVNGNYHDEYAIIGDGSCGFHAANISRGQAVEALLNEAKENTSEATESRYSILNELLICPEEDQALNSLNKEVKEEIKLFKKSIKSIDAQLDKLRKKISKKLAENNIEVPGGASVENIYAFLKNGDYNGPELEQKNSFIESCERKDSEHEQWLNSDKAKRIYIEYVSLFNNVRLNLWVGQYFLKRACKALGKNLRIWNINSENAIYTRDLQVPNMEETNVLLSHEHFNFLESIPSSYKFSDDESRKKSKKRKQITDKKARKKSKQDSLTSALLDNNVVMTRSASNNSDTTVEELSPDVILVRRNT